MRKWDIGYVSKVDLVLKETIKAKQGVVTFGIEL